MNALTACSADRGIMLGKTPTKLMGLNYLLRHMHGCMFLEAKEHPYYMRRLCTVEGTRLYKNGQQLLPKYGFYGTECKDCKKVYHEVPM